MSPRLFLHVFTLEARKQMSYRVDFWCNAFAGTVVAIVIPYFMWTAIFTETSQEVIAGFTLRSMIIYYIAVVLVGRVVRGPDLANTLSQDIYEGSLTRYLVYPSGYLSFKYAQHLGTCLPGIMQFVFFGALFIVIWGVPAEVAITPASVGLCLISVAIANLLYFLLSYPFQAVAFWADNVWSLAVLLRFVSGILGGVYVPLRLYPEWAQEILHFLPFHHLFSFPVRVLTGEVPLAEWGMQSALGLCWCAGIYAVGRLVWRRGELSYTGVGI